MRGQARANGLLVGVAAPPVVLVVAVGTDDDTPGIQVDKAARRIDAAGQLRRPIHHQYECRQLLGLLAGAKARADDPGGRGNLLELDDARRRDDCGREAKKLSENSRGRWYGEKL